MEVKYDIKTTYDKIAKEFNASRVRIWKQVKEFLDQVKDSDENLDIGCGNGKNILYRSSLKFTGIDLSTELVQICKSKNLNVIEGNMTSLPFDNNHFNNIICIASYHHLDNDNDRKKALNEMYRVLKNDGKVLLSVWAMEQPKEGPGSTFKFTKEDELVSWKAKDGITYMRYYHIYPEGALQNEINKLEPRFNIISMTYELGNWFVVLQKNCFI